MEKGSIILYSRRELEVGLMLNNGVHIQSRTDIFFLIYTILTFSLAAAHVDDVAEVKPQKTVKWGS